MAKDIKKISGIGMYGQDIITAGLFGDANLVAYYKLEDANDSKSTYNLTNYNSVSFSAGKYNNGANFGSSNTNKGLIIANSLGIDGGAISISIWCKILSAPVSGAFYDLAIQGNDTSKVYYMIRYFNDSGVLKVQIGRVGYAVGGQYLTVAVDLGTTDFHNLVLSYNGTTLVGYVNGKSIGSVASSGNGSSWSAEGDGFSLGQTYLSPLYRYSSAIIDDVAVFSRALTATEVAKIGRSGVNEIVNVSNNVEATGGTITYDGLYTMHTFTSSGTFTPKHSGNVSALLVAGGGGGGGGYGGGGGAGGLIDNGSVAVTPQGYSIVVGSGGGGSAGGSSNPGGNGDNTTGLGLTAYGGGGGGHGNPQAADKGGQNGGSGGGEGGWIPSTNSTNPANSTGVSGQGYGGGGGASSGTKAGAGGGGRGSVGGNGSAESGGNGGSGYTSTISGQSVAYAGGGGGGCDAGITAGSASAGGGAGGSATWPASANGTGGTANTGGGGGGGSQLGSGASGGSGIVIIKYLSSPVSTDIKKVGGVSNI